MKSLYQAERRCKRWIALVVSLGFVFAGCLKGPPPVLVSSALTDDLDRESLRTALERSISYLKKLPPERVVGEQPRQFTAREVLESLLSFKQLLDRQDCPACWKDNFRDQFDLIPSSADADLETVLFTGYYQPVIEGSLAPTPEYAYPIYATPSDLIVTEEAGFASSSGKTAGRLDGGNLVPYYSRREIDQLGSLRGRGYEIAWVKNPVDLFFLHIQGSGILQLEDGRRLLIGYAGGNGRPYRSIGRLLIDRGKIPQEEMSVQRLRKYLLDYPDEQSEIFSYNESYVFFRFLEEGPLGSLEVPLTRGRSLATDSRLFPKGALAFIIAEKPLVDATGRLVGWQPFARFVLNQDTGGAIRGLQRADLYFGAGLEAEAGAGYMNRPGKLYFLALKKPSATPSVAR